MNPKELEKNYKKNKNLFYNYINYIKSNMEVDIFSIINTTLICDPYITKFPLRFFTELNSIKKENKVWLFIRSSIKFYARNFYYLLIYLIGFFIYKIFYKKSIKNCKIGIDVFFLTDKILQENSFQEVYYFPNLYSVLKKQKINYCFLVRFYQLLSKKPDIIRIVKFFKILNKTDENIIFEYTYINIKDFFNLFYLILFYPFKTLRLIQKEISQQNILFNNELIRDISNQQFDSFSRYIFGKNIAKLSDIEKIYSWCEFQVIERSFNYGIRKSNCNIQLIGCQLYLNYETYFSSYIYDTDYDLLTSFHKVIVNGKYYTFHKHSKKVIYDIGVSFRYTDIFNFIGIENERNILVLGSYVIKDTRYILESIKKINNLSNIIFKTHPLININNFEDLLYNITISNNNIYNLFKNSYIVIGTASGTCLEAVSCGLSVIVVASQDNFTANPLIEVGKGKIWDIAFNQKEIKYVYEKLIKYRKNNINEIKKIASWYKENFFVEPTEENIIKAFKLKETNEK